MARIDPSRVDPRLARLLRLDPNAQAETAQPVEPRPSTSSGGCRNCGKSQTPSADRRDTPVASTDVEENRAPTQDLPDLWAICNEVAQDPATARLLYRMIAGYPMAPPSPELRRLAHQVMDRVWDLYFAPDRYALRVGQELEGHRLDGQRQGRAVVVAIEGEQVGERTVVIEWEDQSRDRIHEDVLWRHLRPRRGARA